MEVVDVILYWYYSRYMPDGSFEDWSIDELIITD